MVRRVLVLAACLGLTLAATSPVSAANINSQNAYLVRDLVADQAGQADRVDPNLVNGWGLTAGPTTPWWVSDNGTAKSTLYQGSGNIVPLVVDVPTRPTGTVFNISLTGGASDFKVSNDGTSLPARFLFATEDGTIRGWNPGVAATTAVLAADRSSAGAIYKGLAIGKSGGAFFLYAADFHNARIDVFDKDFALQAWAGAFTDAGIPKGFAPFGIQNLGGVIYVTYAKQDAAAEDEVAGEGLGYVSAFGTDGSFLWRVASRGELNAPWGLALAPGGFGKFSGDLLVGNFGDGRIHAFAMGEDGWEARGVIKGSDHRPIAIDGLWGIGFGNGFASGATNVLYFAAGPDDEAHGLFGSISVP